MRSVVSAAVAAIVALHSVLGCCWHHAHEAVGATIQTETKVAAPAKSHCGCCHSHDHEKPDGVQEDERPTHDDSSPSPGPCEGKCDTPAVNRVQGDDVNSLSLISLVATIDQPLLLAEAFCPHAACVDLEAKALPVRLHLLNQLLLI